MTVRGGGGRGKGKGYVVVRREGDAFSGSLMSYVDILVLNDVSLSFYTWEVHMLFYLERK